MTWVIMGSLLLELLGASFFSRLDLTSSTTTMMMSTVRSSPTKTPVINTSLSSLLSFWLSSRGMIPLVKISLSGLVFCWLLRSSAMWRMLVPRLLLTPISSIMSGTSLVDLLERFWLFGNGTVCWLITWYSKLLFPMPRLALLRERTV